MEKHRNSKQAIPKAFEDDEGAKNTVKTNGEIFKTNSFC